MCTCMYVCMYVYIYLVLWLDQLLAWLIIRSYIQHQCILFFFFFLIAN